MCVAVALPLSEFPRPVVEAHGLDARTHDRGEPEVRFHWRAQPPRLPVWWEGRLQVVRWGCRVRSAGHLPPTGWTWRASAEAGRWSHLEPEAVVIPAAFGMMGGVWFKVKEGMRGLLVRDRDGTPTAYVTCEPATRYYAVMTRCSCAPVLVGDVI